MLPQTAVALALCLTGGMTVGTIFTLFVVPAVYLPVNARTETTEVLAHEA